MDLIDTVSPFLIPIETSKEGIKVTIDLSKEDYRKYVLNASFQISFRDTLKFMLPFALIIVLILCLLFYSGREIKFLDLKTPYVFLIIFVFLLIIRFSGFGTTKYNEIKKHFPAHYIIHEKGMHASTPLAITDLSWDAFTKATIQKDCLKLFINKKSAIVFPKIFFLENDYDQFCKLVVKKVKVRLPHL